MQRLFTDFHDVTKEEWKQKATKDLKGRPLDSLYWKLPEGFTLEPYLTPDDQPTILRPIAAHAAGKVPGGDARQWDNIQLIPVASEQEANALALQALNAGASGVLFDLAAYSKLPDFPILLKDIQLPYCSLAFSSCLQIPQLFSELKNYVRQQKLDPDQLNGFIVADIVGQMAQTGIADHQGYADWRTQFSNRSRYPHFSSLVLNLEPYHNAGATAVQELALALSLAATYADDLTEEGVSPKDVFNQLAVFVAVGNRYFPEIAKLQSLRYLLATLAKAYGLTDFSPATFGIHVTSSQRDRSVLDENTNLLRHTTQAMSSILGGCTSLTLRPFRPNDTLSRRMARNISTILQEEAYFGKVLNPVDGTYYLQKLQHEFIDGAWQQFLSWEEAGGFRQIMESGQLMQEIEEARQQVDEQVNTRREKVVGVSAYANLKDTVATDLSEPEATGGFLGVKRKAAAFEQARSRAQQLVQEKGQPLQALLLQFGKPEMYRARAAFAADFLQAGGWESREMLLADGGGELPLEQVQLVVLCAADEDYAQLAPERIDALRQQGYTGPIYLAGKPEVLGTEASVDGFINLKSDAPAVYFELLNRVAQRHEA